MRNKNESMALAHSFQGRIALPTVLLFAVSAMWFAGGCSKSGKSGVAGDVKGVSGTCKLEGQDVAGTVFFVGADKKQYQGFIKDGEYLIPDVPAGKYAVTVVSTAGAGLPGKDVKPDSMAVGTASAGVPAPAKYANPATSGLSFEATGGNDTYNIDLKK